MKVFVLITCLSAFLLVFGARPVLADPDPLPETTSATKQPVNLERLQGEYDRRRTEALRPVATWYRAQLE
ncbi:MAG: hypothetical protein M3463_16200, partial [Verrucomicrobiota bacterium]|nr:hypothetical protein [Verrucomicrobiota bacterium]